MDKIKRVFVSMMLAVALLFGGVFSFFGVNHVKAKALHGEYYGADNIIYYFSDYYPTLSNIEMSSYFGAQRMFYDVQRVDENEFSSMVSSNYFSGFGMNCTFILDIKMFTVDTGILDTLFTYLKEEEGCYTGLMLSGYAASSIEDWSFTSNVDIYCTVDFSELEIFAEDIVTRQCGTNPNYAWTTGNGTLDNTTFLFDNIIDNLSEHVGNGLMDLQESSPFFMYFINALFENVEPESTLEYSSYEEMLTLMGIRLLVHITGDNYIDLITGNMESITSISYSTGNTQDYAVVGFSNLSVELYTMIGNFQLGVFNAGVVDDLYEAEYLLPVHILEADKIDFGSDGLVASICTGSANDASAFIDALQALLNGD